MATAIFLTVEDTNAPTIDFTLEREGTAINLAGATVTLALVKESTDSVTNSGHQTCNIISAAAGTVRYSTQVGDFPDEGRYLGDVRITYTDGSLEIMQDQLLVVARKRNPTA